MELERVFTIKEVAALAGWKRQRMLRHLLKINAEIGGMLLHNVGSAKKPRWTVTMKALKRVAPQWLIDDESVEARIAALEEAIAELKGQGERHEKRLDTQTKCLDRIFRVL